ncbi:MAG: isopeptide-forming domain-containing fimbrial protein [Clostridiales bacterium]|nr:isopeptide-forming domain-containing fimbrial protein [Clostridiales bacterium]
MKKIRKIAAFMLALIMVFAVNTAAMAAEKGTYTITIDNPISGETYTAYKVFTVTYNSNYDYTDANSSGQSGVSYTISSSDPWHTLVTNGYTGYESPFTLTANSSGTYTVSLKDTVTYNSESIDVDQSYVAEWFNNIPAASLSAITSGYVSKEASSENLDSSGNLVLDVSDDSLGAGYYYITTAGGATVTVNTVAPHVTVVDKNDVPTLSKYADGAEATSASAGDVITYTLMGYIPLAAANYDAGTYTFTFYDVLPENITYAVGSDNNISGLSVVEVGDSAVAATLTADTDYTVTTGTVSETDTRQTITVEIDSNTAIKYAGHRIIVTYEAVLGSGAVSGTAEENTVTLTYSTDPSNSSKTATLTDSAYVYTYDLNVNKTDGTDALEGAAFTLYQLVSEEDFYNLKAYGSSTPTFYTYDSKTKTFSVTTSYESGKTYIITDDKEISADVATYVEATGITEFADGVTYYTYDSTSDTYTAASEYASGTTYYTKVLTATFTDLGEGTYILVETTTPDGYNTSDPVVFTIEAAYDGSDFSVTSLGTDNTSVTAVEDDNGNASTTTLTTTIENSQGTELPSTGGVGTRIFYTLGSVLVLAAAVLLVTKKRMGRSL